jgi:hypothetical protein
MALAGRARHSSWPVRGTSPACALDGQVAESGAGAGKVYIVPDYRKLETDGAMKPVGITSTNPCAQQCAQQRVKEEFVQ